jgi:DNA-binding NarL/FixJ family response regulator
MQRLKILLADDHTLVAHALTKCLPQEFELIGIVENGLKLLEAARELKPDIILSDISMPAMGGLEALQILRAEGNGVKVLFLTMHADPAMASQALRAGASGFLSKNSAGEELTTALRRVCEGKIYLSPTVAGQMVEMLTSSEHRHGREITARQRDVLRLIAAGMSAKQIAADLEISPRTVETHKYEMMQNLGMQSTAELVRYAIRSGVVSG